MQRDGTGNELTEGGPENLSPTLEDVTEQRENRRYTGPSMDEDDSGITISRRALLAGTATAAGAVILGGAWQSGLLNRFLGNNQGPGQGEQNPGGGGEEQVPTSLLNLDTGKPTVLPFVNQENKDKQGVAKTAVEDSNGLEEVRVFLDNGTQEHELAVHENLDSTQQTLETSYPQRLVAPGDNQLILQATDALGQEKQFDHSFTAESNGHIIDFKNSSGESIGNYSTERTWDDFEFSHDRIWNKRQDWNSRQAYTGMIQTLNSEGKKETYSDEWTSAYYPGDIDLWSRSTFRNHKQAEDVLRFASTATQLEQVAVKGIKNRSRENDEFSATVEQLINTVHTEAEYERKVTTTHVNQVGHGTSIAYVHTEDTELKADNNWWFLDTTWKTVTPIEEATIHDGYNPFVQGYRGDKSDSGELSREKEKIIGVGALQNFLDRTNDVSRWAKGMTFSDQMLEFVYNEHILKNDGSVNPIPDMVEKGGDYQLEDEYVTVIGDSWDSMEFATGEEIYSAAMDMDNTVTKDEAYSILDQTAA